MSGTRKGNKRGLIHLFRRDAFISCKLIGTRLRENYLMITTIVMLIAISIVGGSLSTIIKASGERYYKNMYLSEVVMTSSQSLSYKDSEELYISLKEDKNLKVSCSYSGSYHCKIGSEQIRYGLIDMKAFEEQGIVPANKFHEEGIILSTTAASRNNYHVGDQVQLLSPCIYARDSNGIPIDTVICEEKECILHVVAIIPDAKLLRNEAYIDLHKAEFVNDGIWLEKIYIDGDKDYIDNKLNELKEIYTTIKWASYTDSIRINTEKIDSRFYLMDLVVKVLVFIASIGWINSLRNILLARIKDYDIIRMQGVRPKRIVKIMIYQIVIYIVIGVIFGIFIGTALLELLMYTLEHKFVYQFNFEVVVQMVGIMIGFCTLLIPTIKKICTKKILSENE